MNLDHAWMLSEGWTLLRVTHQNRPPMPLWLAEKIDYACGAYWVHEMRQEVRDADVEGVTRTTQRPYRPTQDDALLGRLVRTKVRSLEWLGAQWCARTDHGEERGNTPHEAVLRALMS